MRIVIDASVAVSWFAHEPASEVNRMLITQAEPLLAPALLLIETTHALVQKARRTEFREEDIERVWDEFSKLQILFIPNEDLLPLATRIAILSQHSLYDCLYLALAHEQQAALATDDRKLIALASNLDPSVPIWRPSLA